MRLFHRKHQCYVVGEGSFTGEHGHLPEVEEEEQNSDVFIAGQLFEATSMKRAQHSIGSLAASRSSLAASRSSLAASRTSLIARRHSSLRNSQSPPRQLEQPLFKLGKSGPNSMTRDDDVVSEDGETA